jgi:hypothetical protein
MVKKQAQKLANLCAHKNCKMLKTKQKVKWLAGKIKWWGKNLHKV